MVCFYHLFIPYKLKKEAFNRLGNPLPNQLSERGQFQLVNLLEDSKLRLL